MLSTMLRLRTDRDRERGFTLIELLVVVLIIGILVGIAIPIFLNQRQKAAFSTLQADVRNATTSMETYLTGNGGYGASFNTNVSTSLPDGTTIVVSDGNKIVGWASIDPTDATKPVGYCIRGTSTKDGGRDVWYDSALGRQSTTKITGATTVCGTNANAVAAA